MKRFAPVVAILLSLAFAAFADVPRPDPTPKVKPKKSIDTRLSITLVKSDTPRLKIPKSRLKELRAELDQMDGGIDNRAENTGTGGITLNRIQTIVSGGLLSLAIVFGGIWFVRTKKGDSKTGRTVAVAAFLLLSGAVATAVLANIGPPEEARSINSKLFSEHVHSYKQASGNIKLEVYDDNGGGGVELEVPDPKGLPVRDEE